MFSNQLVKYFGFILLGWIQKINFSFFFSFFLSYECIECHIKTPSRYLEKKQSYT